MKQETIKQIKSRLERKKLKLKKKIKSNTNPISSKIPIELFNLIIKKCNKLNKTPSEYIRDVLKKELKGGLKNEQFYL